MVTLLKPMPAEWAPLVWAWTQQHPELNYDDLTPTTERGFTRYLRDKVLGCDTWGVENAGGPCGSICFKKESEYAGFFGGICFDEKVWGTGVAAFSVEAVIEELFAEGVLWIGAGVFQTNGRVQTFLKRLGAVDVGEIGSVTQHGRPVAIHLMEIVRPSRPVEARAACRMA